MLQRVFAADLARPAAACGWQLAGVEARPGRQPAWKGSRSAGAGFRAAARVASRMWHGWRAAGGRPRRAPRRLRWGELAGVGPARLALIRVGALAAQDARQRPGQGPRVFGRDEDAAALARGARPAVDRDADDRDAWGQASRRTRARASTASCRAA